ncbi:SDR family oxidoreductase [Streptomyces sp. NPDC093065]|uniref:SDR family oxidoreductase n=1 Tax=Streptomyces sp. NPDC093065 TaxID=3366021 RepID=UPI003801260C
MQAGEADVVDDAVDVVRSEFRYGRPEEIAAGVVFLAGPQASYVTGAVPRIDGGYGALAARAPTAGRHGCRAPGCWLRSPVAAALVRRFGCHLVAPATGDVHDGGSGSGSVEQ